MSEALKEARDFRDTSDIDEGTDIDEAKGHLSYDEWLKKVKGIKKGAYGINSDEHAKYSGEWRDYITALFNNLPPIKKESNLEEIVGGQGEMTITKDGGVMIIKTRDWQTYKAKGWVKREEVEEANSVKIRDLDGVEIHGRYIDFNLKVGRLLSKHKVKFGGLTGYGIDDVSMLGKDTDVKNFLKDMGHKQRVNMKYRKTFREALNDVDKKDKPEVKPEAPAEKPAEDKDAIIQQLQAEIQQLQLQLTTAVPPMPHPETGEVPLRTGIAGALLDKKGPSPKIDKESNKKKLKMSLGKSKVTVDPDVDIGQISGGIQTGTGNLH